jgi:NADPH:quinone reductase
MNIQKSQAGTRALRVAQKAESFDSVHLDVVELPVPEPGPGQVLVEVVSSAVNPSDVKATLGIMPHAVWPRIPGRDYAGIVRKGPDHLIGREVWGGGGELGITQNGTHSTHVVLPVAAMRDKPTSLSFEEAGAIGVPFITAYEGLREAGGIQPFDTVLVCGVNGKVAQAVIQMATMARARVFAVSYRPTEYSGHANETVEIFDTSSQDVAAEIRERTAGRGVDIVFNTVGSPYFALGNAVLAKLGRHIFISTFEREVPFDIFPFYRGRQRFVGVDTLALDATYCATIFDRLGPKFDQGYLRPFPIKPDAIYGLPEARDAYARVFGATPDRIVLKP